MVRAKFKVDSITRTMGWRNDPENGDCIPAVLNTVAMSLVTTGSKENEAFSIAIPSFGKLEMGSVCECPFDLGKEYYLDFTPADRA